MREYSGFAPKPCYELSGHFRIFQEIRIAFAEVTYDKVDLEIEQSDTGEISDECTILPDVNSSQEQLCGGTWHRRAVGLCVILQMRL